MTETPPEPTGKTVGDHLARTVKRLREERRLTLTEFARRMAALGHPIGRMGVQRLERGERKVNVDEVNALARVLDVPPVLLLFPVGVDAETELLPGLTVDTWTAAKWFMGKRADEVTTDPPSAEWAVVHLYQEHDRLFGLFDEAYADVVLFPPVEGDPEKKIANRRVRLHLRDLRTIRANMRHRNLEPPALDSDVADLVDDGRQFFITPGELAGLFPDKPEDRARLRPVDVAERADDPSTWKEGK